MRHFSLRHVRVPIRCAHRFAQPPGLRLVRCVRPGVAIRFGIGLLALAWLSCMQVAAALGRSAAPPPGPAIAATTGAPASAGGYYLNVAQLDHPLRPFEHLPKHASIRLHAAVVTVPDPVETRLGRSFDIELAALTSAFQASGYVLDGFAFTWAPRELDPDGNQKVSRDQKGRELPSVMLFRKDDWRSCGPDMVTAADFCGSTYFALFLVGETPRSGVHPLAFARAARCAVALDDAGRGREFQHPGDFNGADCDQLPAGDLAAGTVVSTCTRRLNVIGPAFSGSMESMAAALSRAASAAAGAGCGRGTPPIKAAASFLDIRLLSPSASIDSNDDVRYHDYLSAAATGDVRVQLQYRSLAYSVSDQMQNLLKYLRKRTQWPNNKVVVFGEESSFGLGAKSVATDENGDACNPSDPPKDRSRCPIQLFNVQFPPNIASIRAEHVRIRQVKDRQRRQIMPERLLELDLTGVDQGIDQPPTYQASLSSRSDELMLYQTFDALNKYVQPAAVIIVATDVRDRLFLLSEIRNAFPGALPIVLEQDNLLVHPDYRAISRGSITMPAGRTLVCLTQADGGVVVTPCYPDSAPEKSAVSPPGDKKSGLSYFAFATDYAANTFRAIVQLANSPAGLPAPDAQLAPAMLVATLAGFQEIEESPCPAANKGASMVVRCPQRGILIVADTRLQLQQPIYLAMSLFFIGMLVVTTWLLRNERKVTPVTLPVVRHALRWTRLAANGLEAPGRISVTWLWAWLAFASGGLIVAGTKLVGEFGSVRYHSDFLAHGRDAWTLLGLCLAYAGFVAFAVLRGQVWNARCAYLARELGEGSRLRKRLGPLGRWWAIISMPVMLAYFYLSVSDRSPTGVDSPWVSALSGLFALGGSTFFLIIFMEGLDRWQRICRELGKTIRVVHAQSKVDPHLEEWPTPEMLDEPSRSPFNIGMRMDNYHAWRQPDVDPWIAQTKALLAGQWPFQSASDGSFAQWQAQLVAEMKLAAVAVRAAAWCSILGAVLALMLIQVYPPAYERLQTTVAAILLALGAGFIVHAVITLEKDRLLGCMFTNNKDQLTFGAALSALWPKLLALGSLLAMIFLPDAWDWLGGLVKAVNSIR
ncbi:MAG TPA: hypothetical protein VN624_17400 [Rhodanobacter sp.]|nr:hypothetical protein [Rhodanobacter sp.]